MDGKAQLESLESEKEQMIQRYIDLQDQADALNETIYRVCCDIEILNCRIGKAKEDLHKAELKARAKDAVKPPPTNGGSKP